MRLKQYWNSSTRGVGRYDNASSWNAKLNIFKNEMFYQVSNRNSMEDVSESVCWNRIILGCFLDNFRLH